LLPFPLEALIKGIIKRIGILYICPGSRVEFGPERTKNFARPMTPFQRSVKIRVVCTVEFVLGLDIEGDIGLGGLTELAQINIGNSSSSSSNALAVSSIIISTSCVMMHRWPSADCYCCCAAWYRWRSSD
jgi:hypothetical protein